MDVRLTTRTARPLLIVMVACAAMFVCVSTAFAAATVQGRVVDSGGVGVSGVIVQALTYDTFQGAWLAETLAYTDARGSYTVAIPSDVPVVIDFDGTNVGYSRATYGASAYQDYATAHQITASDALVTLADQVLVRDATVVRRLAGMNRYSSSVAIARDTFDPTGSRAWPTVTDVIIASGEDRSAADPLAAAGLCGAYNAPLLLTASTAVDASVKQAVIEIATAAKARGERLTLHIVGGPAALPDGRIDEIVFAVGAAGAGTVTRDRIISVGDRFDSAVAIARRVIAKSGNPDVVLIANGADASHYVDVLALSPVASATQGAGQHYPLLLVRKDAIPGATRQLLDELKSAGAAKTTVVAGGPAAISAEVVSALGAQWLWGDTRYETAVLVADTAVARGWLDYDRVGVAAKVPDALTGGATVGLDRGVVVLTESSRLAPTTQAWMSAHRSAIWECDVFGGTAVVTQNVYDSVRAQLVR